MTLTEYTFGVIESIGMIVTLTLVLVELYRQRIAKQFDSYLGISRANQALLWEQVKDAELDEVWDPLAPDRKNLFDERQASGEMWAVWYEMTTQERKCYRFIRTALENIEQAWQAHERGWIDQQTWEKWESWARAWRSTDYYVYVTSPTECRDCYISNFLDWIDSVAPVKSPTP